MNIYDVHVWYGIDGTLRKKYRVIASTPQMAEKVIVTYLHEVEAIIATDIEVEFLYEAREGVVLC